MRFTEIENLVPVQTIANTIKDTKCSVVVLNDYNDWRSDLFQQEAATKFENCS
jgi:hypothetical protein